MSKRLDRFADSISRFHARLGSAVAWLTLAMVLVGAYNAAGRYLGRFTGWQLSSNAYLELQWYLFSMVFLLGAANALERGAHVRVDVLYGRLSPRAQAWIDFVGALVFLLPFAAFGAFMALPTVRNSWRVLEGSPDPGGLPRYPIKTVIPIAFALLFLQGIAEAIKSWRRARTSEGPTPEAEVGHGL